MRKVFLSLLTFCLVVCGVIGNGGSVSAALYEDTPHKKQSWITVAEGELDNQDPKLASSSEDESRVISEFVSNNINDSMSIIEKLDKIGEFVANYSYDNSSSGTLLQSGVGDCAQFSTLVCEIAEACGYKTGIRNASGKYNGNNPSSNHENALVYSGDDVYNIRVGESSHTDGMWEVVYLGSGFEYTKDEYGNVVFMQYNGTKTEINLADGLKDWVGGPSEVAKVDVQAIERSTNIKSIIIPETVKEISDLYYMSISSDNYLTVKFLGDAPSITSEYCFYDLNVTAYYPKGNSTWTPEVMRDYSGNVSWYPYEKEMSGNEGSGSSGSTENTNPVTPPSNMPESGNTSSNNTSNNSGGSSNTTVNNSQVVVQKVDSRLAFEKGSIVKKYGDGSFINKIFSVGDGVISYTSSKPSVAIVNNYGRVTIKGTGTTVITATISEGIKFKSSRASYVLKVNRGSLKVSCKGSLVYTGKTQKPRVTVKVGSKKVSPKYYSIKYSNTKNIGKGRVTVTPRGSYAKKFGTTVRTIIVKPNTVKLSSVKSSSKGKITVKYGKVRGSITGYQVAYKKKGSSKWVYKNVSAKKSSYTLSKLSRKKEYSIRVRAYKVVKGTKYYGSFSKTKKVKTK